MAFRDGTAERDVTLRMARILKKKLLAEGYDVLMVRHGEFGADMQVALVNEGPCTIIIDTDEWKKKE